MVSPLIEESPSLDAYPDPQSGTRVNPTLKWESPEQIEEDECDRWFPLALEQGGNDEEEEIGVLERCALHLSPVFVASSPAPLFNTTANKWHYLMDLACDYTIWQFRVS